MARWRRSRASGRMPAVPPAHAARARRARRARPARTWRSSPAEARAMRVGSSTSKACGSSATTGSRLRGRLAAAPFAETRRSIASQIAAAVELRATCIADTTPASSSRTSDGRSSVHYRLADPRIVPELSARSRAIAKRARTLASRAARKCWSFVRRWRSTKARRRSQSPRNSGALGIARRCSAPATTERTRTCFARCDSRSRPPSPFASARNPRSSARPARVQRCRHRRAIRYELLVARRRTSASRSPAKRLPCLFFAAFAGFAGFAPASRRLGRLRGLRPALAVRLVWRRSLRRLASTLLARAAAAAASGCARCTAVGGRRRRRWRAAALDASVIRGGAAAMRGRLVRAASAFATAARSAAIFDRGRAALFRWPAACRARLRLRGSACQPSSGVICPRLTMY